MREMQVGMIAAVSQNGILGRHGRIPWDEPADRRRFKTLTLGTTVIIGRRTWTSLPGPLPGRTVWVLSKTDIPSVPTFRRLTDAIAAASGPIWLAGGARVYQEGFKVADHLDLTRIPVEVDPEGAVYFPAIDPKTWRLVDERPHPEDRRLTVCRYVRG